jgi:hypothetical protein
MNKIEKVLSIIHPNKDKDYGFYFINLWTHFKKYNIKDFVLIHIEFQNHEYNWNIAMRLFNFDFGYISKSKQGNKK